MEKSGSNMLDRVSDGRLSPTHKFYQKRDTYTDCYLDGWCSRRRRRTLRAKITTQEYDATGGDLLTQKHKNGETERSNRTIL